MIQIPNSKRYDLEERTAKFKDFILRMKICRKETKESYLWLRLCEVDQLLKLEKERIELLKEAVELRKIFSSILGKANNLDIRI